MLHFRVDELILSMPHLAESEHTAPAYIADNESRDAIFTAPANLDDRPVSGASGSSMNASWVGRVVVAGG